MNALAKYHLAKFDQKRQEIHHEVEAKSRKWANLIAAAAVGATLAGVLIGLLHKMNS